MLRGSWTWYISTFYFSFFTFHQLTLFSWVISLLQDINPLFCFYLSFSIHLVSTLPHSNERYWTVLVFKLVCLISLNIMHFHIHQFFYKCLKFIILIPSIISLYIDIMFSISNHLWMAMQAASGFSYWIAVI